MSPKVYIACLASYNAGILHGKWIDLIDQDIQTQITKILAQSPIEQAEEWAVHDYECCGHLSEYGCINSLTKIKNAYVQVEEEHVEWELFIKFCSHISSELQPEQIETYQDSYAGSANNLEDWCHQFLEEAGILDQIPDNLRFYFNIERYASDMEINDLFTIEHNGQTHVFRNV